MALDVSEAIALAKDLLETSSDFHPHDPILAAEFSNRAFEICDDLGIDRALIGEQPADLADEAGGDDTEAADDEARQTSDQLRDLLQQQARVLQNARQEENLEAPKPAKRSFRLFGRSDNQGFGKLQSASA